MSTWIGTYGCLGSDFVSAGGCCGSNISFAMLAGLSTGSGTSVSVFASTLTSGCSLSDGAAVGCGAGAGSNLAGSAGFSIEIGTSHVLGSMVAIVFGAVAAVLGDIFGFSGAFATGVGNLPNEVVALGNVGTSFGGSTLVGSDLGAGAGALPKEVVALGSVGTSFGGSFNNNSLAMLAGAGALPNEGVALGNVGTAFGGSTLTGSLGAGVGALPNEVVALGNGCGGVACCCFNLSCSFSQAGFTHCLSNSSCFCCSILSSLSCLLCSASASLSCLRRSALSLFVSGRCSLSVSEE